MLHWVIYTVRGKEQKKKKRPGADRGSDHELLIAKFRLKLKKVGKTTGPFRYGPYNYTVEVTNRFMGLDLIHRVLEKLWTEVWNIVQEAVIKTTHFMAIHSSIPACRIPWTGGLQFIHRVMKSQAQLKRLSTHTSEISAMTEACTVCCGTDGKEYPTCLGTWRRLLRGYDTWNEILRYEW